MFRHVLNGVLALSAALAVGAPSAASSRVTASDEQHNVIRLKYAEADLRTPRGAKALALRLRVAAADVCGGELPLVRTGDQFTRCREATIDRAIAPLNEPLLAAALGHRSAPDMQASR